MNILQMKKYDYLIIGSGLFGAVFAHQAGLNDKTCLVLEKRSHVGGNVHCEEVEGINIHKYGAHIFHTSNKNIWEYVNNLVEFNRYTNSPIVNYKGQLFNLPFNMNTFYWLWGVKTPEEAKKRIASEVSKYQHIEPCNLEEQALKLVGEDIYTKFIKGYTEKQWGCKATELQAFIIKRIPLRFTFDNNYFNDAYQGIPNGGYNSLINKLLKKSDIVLNVNYLEHKEKYESVAKKVIYTGMIDEYFAYKYGKLEYRSLRFDSKIMNVSDFQGNAVVNYTDRETPYTRIIEHKHFEFGKQTKTIVTKEYPQEWNIGKEAYYPINNQRNNSIYEKYKKEAENLTSVFFGGRLGEYAYYDMDITIMKSLELFEKLQ